MSNEPEVIPTSLEFHRDPIGVFALTETLPSVMSRHGIVGPTGPSEGGQLGPPDGLLEVGWHEKTMMNFQES